MSGSRTVRKVLDVLPLPALLLALVVVTVVLAAPASRAARDCIGLGANVACVRSGNAVLDACDRAADGQAVIAHAINGRGGQWYVTDRNGLEPGCGKLPVPTPPITHFWVCRANDVRSPAHTCSAPMTPESLGPRATEFDDG